MADTSLDLREPRGSSPLLKWALIGMTLLVLLGAGGAAWYFFLGGREHFSSQQPKVEAPLPYFLELKPFVVTMPSSSGVTHFVQLGVSLQLPRAPAGEMVTSLLPEIQDTMGQT